MHGALIALAATGALLAACFALQMRRCSWAARGGALGLVAVGAAVGLIRTAVAGDGREVFGYGLACFMGSWVVATLGRPLRLIDDDKEVPLHRWCQECGRGNDGESHTKYQVAFIVLVIVSVISVAVV